MFFRRLSASSNNPSVLEPFKCGVIHPPKTRRIFIHMPNITNSETEEETHIETTVESFIDATNSSANETSSMFGLHEQDIAKKEQEEPILPETSGGITRIVNGVECPPGDCPWQVETCKHGLFFCMILEFLET